MTTTSHRAFKKALFSFAAIACYTCLSLQTPVKAETRHLPADVPAVRRTIEYTYDANGLLSGMVVTNEGLAENETTRLNTLYTFIKKN